MKTTLSGTSGAFVVPACDGYAVAGRRERFGLIGHIDAVSPQIKGMTLSTETVVANPIPLLVRHRGASG